MRLDLLLDKTKAKGNKEEIRRLPPSIASEERPYDIISPIALDITPSYEDPPSSNTNHKNNLNLVEPPTYEIAQTPKNNQRQSGDKLETKRRQTEDKPETNKRQTGDKSTTVTKKVETNRRQNWRQTEDKPKTNREQSGDKPKTKNSPITELIGLQRLTLILIYNECKKVRSHVTPFLTLEYLASRLKTTTSSVKKTLQRIEQKGFILRKSYKNGRGGCSQYELLEQPFQELLLLETENKITSYFEEKKDETEDKLRIKWGQTEDKVESQPETTPSSSSSYINNNNTTTTKGVDLEKNSLPEEFQFISTQPLEEFGFRQFHLAQLHKSGKLTSEQIQESINYFAFDLQNNNKGEKINGSPLNYFMGILRSGTPYSPPENYESAETKAMKLYVERTKKLRREEEAAKKEAQTFAFQEWVDSLAEEEINLFSAEYKSRKNDDPLKQGALRLHFNQNVWPGKLLELSK